MATRSKRAAATPRHPEKKWGPFHGGVGVAVWLNEVETDKGPRYFRSLTVTPRRYLDKKEAVWKNASSLRATDLPSLILALEAAHAFMTSAPLPGKPAEEDQIEDPHALNIDPPPF
jgi:hypothetical protein